MPWPDEPGGRIGSHTAWRAVIVVIGVVLIVVIIGVVGLFLANRSAINGTRELSCRVGAFFVGQPITQQPGQSHADFVQTVRKAESFLRALKEQDCSGVHGAAITRQQITRELRRLHRAAPRAGGGDHSHATGLSPPSSPARGGPSPAAPVPPTPPPGSSTPPGSNGNPAPPPTTTTTPSPPPTTTPSPPPKPPPGPVDRITHLVCRVNALGVRVCVSLP